MARSSEDYLKLLQSLLPIGKAWNRDPDSNFTNFLHGFADELARIDAKVENLLIESRTNTTTECIDEHEIDFGIPDECIQAADTIENRRLLVNTRLRLLGGQHKGYFVEVADNLDRMIIIFEFKPFWSGLGVCGDPIGDAKIIYYWAVSIYFQNSFVEYADVYDGACGDLLADMPLVQQMICILEKQRPAHTTILYDWYGAGFSSAYNCGFNSLPCKGEVYFNPGGFSDGFSYGFNGRVRNDVLGPTYWDGGFSRGFNHVAFNINKNIYLTPYFDGGFSKGFSTGFDVIYGHDQII